MAVVRQNFTVSSSLRWRLKKPKDHPKQSNLLDFSKEKENDCPLQSQLRTSSPAFEINWKC